MKQIAYFGFCLKMSKNLKLGKKFPRNGENHSLNILLGARESMFLDDISPIPSYQRNYKALAFFKLPL